MRYISREGASLDIYMRYISREGRKTQGPPCKWKRERYISERDVCRTDTWPLKEG